MQFGQPTEGLTTNIIARWKDDVERHVNVVVASPAGLLFGRLNTRSKSIPSDSIPLWQHTEERAQARVTQETKTSPSN